MVKKIHCKIDENDWVKAEASLSEENITISMMELGNQHSVILTPADARKFRKQIKKALEAIEGVDEEEALKKDPNFPDWFQKGAIVEITDNSNEHAFAIGEKVRVGTELGDEGAAIRCDYLDGRDYWYVLPSDCKPA